MEILDYRPLLLFIVEIILAILILKKGKYAQKLVALFLLFLAGYQLGEFIIIKNPSLPIGFQLAFFSTTLLPPIGIFLLEKIRKRYLGGRIILMFSAVLATSFLLNPNAYVLSDKCACFAKFIPSQGHESFLAFWGIFYVVALTYGTVLSGYFYRKAVGEINKKRFLFVLAAYLFIFPLSFILTLFFGLDLSYVISIMCSLGLVGGIFFFKVGMLEDKTLKK